MRTIILISFSLLSMLSVLGQDAPVFAFVQNQGGKAGMAEASAYKYEVADAVFQNLLRTRGDIRQLPPTLTMNNGEQYIAWMNPVAIQIGLEERAYDVCASFGADSLNALAVLLAHELTHYYEKHDWNRNFAHANQHTAAARHVHTSDESVLQETQADYIGGFLAFSAGYNAYNLMPRLLDALYRAYGLPESVPGYPALGERVELSLIAMEKLRDLQTVFTTARFLSQLENYEAAAQYHRFIMQDYQSREVYNNAGVNLALEALSYFGATEMPYVLPLELDANSRLNALKGVLADRIKIREGLLRQAIDQFDKTITLDPTYAPGYLNKASAYALVGAWEDARYWVSKGIRATPPPHTSFRILEGITAAMQADTATALRILSAAQAEGSTLAGINLDILKSRTPLPRVYTTTPTMELIGGVSLDAFLANPSVDKEIKLAKDVICGVKTMPNHKIYVHYANDGRLYTVVQWCEADCADATQKGVRNGHATEEVTRQYGTPQRVLSTREGTTWLYPAFQLLFSISEQGHVKGWGTYRKS